MSTTNGLFPDKVFLNGTIITMDETKPTAEAAATLGDRVVAVGCRDSILQLLGPKTLVIDLVGKTMLPGLIEPHNHFGLFGPWAMYQVNLSPPPLGAIANINDLVDALSERTDKLHEGEWVLGFNYDDTRLAEGCHPTRHDLDRVSKDLPVFITHISGHISVANTRALEMAGIRSCTPEPVGGSIRRSPGGREPDGVLEEMAAQSLVSSILPTLSLDRRIKALSYASQQYLRVGVTSSSDAGVALEDFGTKDEIIAYQQALRREMLPIRTTMMVAAELLLGQHGEKVAFLSGFGDNRLKIGPVKIIGDGSIQGYTGWLSTPYHVPFQGNPAYCGYPVTPPARLNKIVRLAHKAGFQIAIHANGDAAIDAAIDAYRLAQEAYPRPDVRHRIEHCQMVREDQLDAIAEMGITPSFFVSHTYYWGDHHEAISIGPERAARISPLSSALKRGIKFSVHSDCPVTPVSPLFCVSAAVNRMTTSGEVLGPEQRITPYEALRAVTIDAAWQNFEEKIKGSIEPGKLADFTVLSANPLEVDPIRIKDIKVEEVIIGGKSAYRAE